MDRNPREFGAHGCRSYRADRRPSQIVDSVCAHSSFPTTRSTASLASLPFAQTPGMRSKTPQRRPQATVQAVAPNNNQARDLMACRSWVPLLRVPLRFMEEHVRGQNRGAAAFMWFAHHRSHCRSNRRASSDFDQSGTLTIAAVTFDLLSKPFRPSRLFDEVAST